MVFASSTAQFLVTVFWQPTLSHVLGGTPYFSLSPSLALVQLSDVHVHPFSAGCVTKC